jgi:hypothetical protein
LGVVVRREVARGEKTAEDQGVPWMKTRVCCFGFVGDGLFGWMEEEEEEERRVYLICQSSWWKVDGKGIDDIVTTFVGFLLELLQVFKCLILALEGDGGATRTSIVDLEDQALLGYWWCFICVYCRFSHAAI